MTSTNAVVFFCGLLLLTLHRPTSAQGGACTDYTLLNCNVEDNCLGVECVYDFLITLLTVSDCEDPVKLDFRVMGSSGSCLKTIVVSGQGSFSGDMMVGNLLLHVIIHFNRNASHLQFRVFSTSYILISYVTDKTINILWVDFTILQILGVSKFLMAFCKTGLVGRHK